MSGKYRILSLDGGGSWALIQAKALIDLYGEEARGRDVLGKFDMAAANSGGSLVLGGLLEDMTLKEILDSFLNEAKRRSLFPPAKTLGGMFFRLLNTLVGIGPKYSAAGKIKGIRAYLPRTGALNLPEVARGLQAHTHGRDVHVLIMGFDYDVNRSAFFRSAQAGTDAQGNPLGLSSEATLAEAIHAATNAPVNYFDAPALFDDPTKRYWDGAIAGYNNPLMAAVTEALTMGVNATDIAALSLGTGSVVLPLAPPGAKASVFEQPRVTPGLLTDLPKLAKSILDDPPDAATYIAHVVTGEGRGLPSPLQSRIVRMNPLVSPIRKNGKWNDPGGRGEDAFKKISTLDMDAVDEKQVRTIVDYAELWLQDIAPNQPIRMDGATRRIEIGHGFFSQARDAWKIIAP